MDSKSQEADGEHDAAKVLARKQKCLSHILKIYGLKIHVTA